MSERVKLTFEQRERVVGVLDEIDRDPDAAATELIYLRDRVTAALADALSGTPAAAPSPRPESTTLDGIMALVEAYAELREEHQGPAAYKVVPVVGEAKDAVRTAIERALAGRGDAGTSQPDCGHFGCLRDGVKKCKHATAEDLADVHSLVRVPSPSDSERLVNIVEAAERFRAFVVEFGPSMGDEQVDDVFDEILSGRRVQRSGRVEDAEPIGSRGLGGTGKNVPHASSPEAG